MASTSASTISTLSVPMPVDMQLRRMQRYVPVAVVISRLLRSSSTSSQRDATLATRPGSPTSRMYSASSPASRAMWYWRLPVRGASAWVGWDKRSSSCVIAREYTPRSRSRAVLVRHANERELGSSSRVLVDVVGRDRRLLRLLRAESAREQDRGDQDGDPDGQHSRGRCSTAVIAP